MRNVCSLYLVSSHSRFRFELVSLTNTHTHTHTHIHTYTHIYRCLSQVITQLKHAIQPALNEVTIVWEGAAGPPPDYKTTDAAAGADAKPAGDAGGHGHGLLSAFAPSAIGSLLGFTKKTPKPENPADAEGYARAPFINPPVLSGERFLSFVLVAKDGKPPAAVHITAKSPVGDLDVRLPVTEADVVQVCAFYSLTLHVTDSACSRHALAVWTCTVCSLNSMTT